MDELVQEKLRQLEQQDSVADVLRRARALVDRPEKWVKFPKSWGGQYCAGLAISDGVCRRGSDWYGPTQFLVKAIGAQYVGDLYDWNDAPDRTHAEVLQAFDRAIAMAERDAGAPAPSSLLEAQGL